MNTFFISLMNATGWTLIHSLWQAAIIFVLVKVLLLFFKQAPAQFKYFLSLAALLGIMICVVVSFSRQWQIQQEHLAIFMAGSPLNPTNILPIANVPDSYNRSLFTSAHWLPVLDGLYIIGLLFFLGKFSRDVLALFFIRKSRVLPFDPAWENYLKRLSSEWHISKSVRMYLSEYLDVPIVIGALKPVIYLPFMMANNMTSDQIESILLHELAHIKRNDFLVNILQTTIETLLFFNPFVWQLSKMIRNERENCCDDMVLSYVQPKLYAEALLAVSEGVLSAEKQRLYKGKFALAATTEKQELFHRIKRMMESKTKKLNVMQKMLVLLILLGGMSSIAWLAPGKAVKKEKELKSAQRLKGDNFMVSKDTLPLPPPPPPPSPEIKTPPVPKMSVPPPPPPPPIPDSLGNYSSDSNHNISYRLNVNGLDSANLARLNNQMKNYYNSPEWKKYQQDLQASVKKMKSYFNSPEWKKYQEELQSSSKKMERYFNSPEWKKYQKDLQKYSRKMAEKLNSAVWKNYSKELDTNSKRVAEQVKRMAAENQQAAAYFQREELKQRMDSLRAKISANRGSLDSIHARIAQQMASMRGNADDVIAAITNKFVSLMTADGLLTDKQDSNIRLNKNGLYIDGKRQLDKYYKKYKSIMGENVDIDINSNTKKEMHKSDAGKIDNN